MRKRGTHRYHCIQQTRIRVGCVIRTILYLSSPANYLQPTTINMDMEKEEPIAHNRDREDHYLEEAPAIIATDDFWDLMNNSQRSERSGGDHEARRETARRRKRQQALKKKPSKKQSRRSTKSLRSEQSISSSRLSLLEDGSSGGHASYSDTKVDDQHGWTTAEDDALKQKLRLAPEAEGIFQDEGDYMEGGLGSTQLRRQTTSRHYSLGGQQPGVVYVEGGGRRRYSFEDNSVPAPLITSSSSSSTPHNHDANTTAATSNTSPHDDDVLVRAHVVTPEEESAKIFAMATLDPWRRRHQ